MCWFTTTTTSPFGFQCSGPSYEREHHVLVFCTNINRSGLAICPSGRTRATRRSGSHSPQNGKGREEHVETGDAAEPRASQRAYPLARGRRPVSVRVRIRAATTVKEAVRQVPGPLRRYGGYAEDPYRVCVLVEWRAFGGCLPVGARTRGKNKGRGFKGEEKEKTSGRRGTVAVSMEKARNGCEIGVEKGLWWMSWRLDSGIKVRADGRRVEPDGRYMPCKSWPLERRLMEHVGSPGRLCARGSRGRDE